jgi:DNA mismatch endonuclease (patch repair protein)
MDKLTEEKRSWNMSRISSKNTKAEIVARKILSSMGFRFRLHKKNLSGKPDIVLPKYKTAIFVHGCFWHRHKNCKDATTPKTNIDFWTKKFQGNIKRDRKNRTHLKKAGWKVIVVWECDLKNPLKLSRYLSRNIGR